jgi:hypothetical protein
MALAAASVSCTGLPVLPDYIKLKTQIAEGGIVLQEFRGMGCPHHLSEYPHSCPLKECPLDVPESLTTEISILPVRTKAILISAIYDSYCTV